MQVPQECQQQMTDCRLEIKYHAGLGLIKRPARELNNNNIIYNNK